MNKLNNMNCRGFDLQQFSLQKAMTASRKNFGNLQNISKIFVILVGLKLIFIIAFLCLREVDQHGTYNNFHKSHFELSRIGVKDYPVAQNYERWDWNNYEFIKYERERTGNGEQGRGHQLTDLDERNLDARLEKIEGLNVIVSDKISVNRSVSDSRPRV
jgi:hypothetical protein